MDTKTRQVIAVHVGDRSRKSAKRLWAKIPEVYRQHATFFTDQYVVYEGVIPTAQHKAISKLARKTNHLANHIGAIKLFICHYNLTRAAV
jgi:insertion element IS1 protein InsB